jgi:RimJ/RimL family protein N-acetyltransferase
VPQVILNTSRVFDFVQHRVPLNATAGMQGIGLERDGDLVAGVIYEGHNGHNIWMHVAAEPGKRWLNRAFLHTCFAYPFEQLKLSRVSGYVEAKNTDARRFDEHLGFKHEATLHGAASDGGDVLIYAMRREDCKYVNPQ